MSGAFSVTLTPLFTAVPAVSRPRATTDLVAVAWLKGVAGIPPGSVATTLPSDTSAWAASGFVQVTCVGGSPEPHMPLRVPVVSVDCWAVNPNSGRPPWGKAATLAELVRDGTLAGDAGRVVTLPVGGLSARVLSAWALTEARRILDDDASYARYSLDVSLAWVAIS
jgi:hypothetical protein